MENHDLALERQIQEYQDDGFVLITLIGSRPIGSLILKRSSSEDMLDPGWWLLSMLVRLRYRGAGIGLNLLNQALDEAASKGASRLNLLVEDGNKAALGLYFKLGFQLFSIPELDAKLESEVQNGLPRRIILSRSLGNPGE